MRVFREALVEVISERLVVRLRKPLHNDFQRNAAIAEMCILGKNHHAVTLRKAAVLRSFNGDWTQRRRVENNCSGPSCCKHRDHCFLIVTSLVVTSIACHAPPTFSRSRWTRSVEVFSNRRTHGGQVRTCFVVGQQTAGWTRRTRSHADCCYRFFRRSHMGAQRPRRNAELRLSVSRPCIRRPREWTRVCRRSSSEQTRGAKFCRVAVGSCACHSRIPWSCLARLRGPVHGKATPGHGHRKRTCRSTVQLP